MAEKSQTKIISKTRFDIMKTLRIITLMDECFCPAQIVEFEGLYVKYSVYYKEKTRRK